MIINPKDQALMDKFYKSNEIVIVGGKPVDWRTMPETEPPDESGDADDDDKANPDINLPKSDVAR